MIDSTENIKLDKDKFCFQLMTQPGRVCSCLRGVVIDSELKKSQCEKPVKVLMTKKSSFDRFIKHRIEMYKFPSAYGLWKHKA